MSDETMTPDDADEQVVYAAESLSEFVERGQYKQLLEARHEALRGIREARMLGESRRRSEREAAALRARSGVESYVLTVQELIHQADDGAEVWTKRPLGEVEISNAIDVDGDVQNVRDVRTTLPVKNGKIVVNGLKTYLQLPNHRIQVQYDVELPRRGHATKTETSQTTMGTPIHVSMAAFSATESLLRSLDIGISLGAAEDAGWDTSYRDSEE